MAKIQEVAVIGISCRFPDADNYQDFWKNLYSSKNSIQKMPNERLHSQKIKVEDDHRSSNYGGFIKDIDMFDAKFFGISPKEAESIDPQQRIMLEMTWACLEDAGYLPSQCSGGNIGLFLASGNYDYKELLEQDEKNIPIHFLTGTVPSIIPNRVSYFYNFRGPSISIDAGCAGSLVALDFAMKSLNQEECELAFAGGINIICNENRYIPYNNLNMLSPTGQCRTFDKDADGYVRGEGAGLILLKPLKKAIEDGDSIHAVIKSIAVNHGGSSKSLTSPNPFAQARVIAAAWKKAGVSPNQISYIEAHGTGTPLGDPIEINGLKRAFSVLFKEYKLSFNNQHFCGLGSLKPNIGHLEPAAGIAGIIKVILAMKHKKLPGLQNLNNINPRIDLKQSPFYLVEKPQTWESHKDNNNLIPLYAGVSSFSLGGINSHVVIEEAPKKSIDETKSIKPFYLVTLSSKTREALRTKIKDLCEWLKDSGKNRSLCDISYTLNAKRTHFEHRLAWIVDSKKTFLTCLLKTFEKAFQENSILPEFVNDKSDLLLKNDGEALIIEKLTYSIEDKEKYYDSLLILADLYIKGNPLNWEALHAGETKINIFLPAYPFDKQRYWLPEFNPDSPMISSGHENIGLSAIEEYLEKLFSQELKLKDEIDKHKPFHEYGLDSVIMMIMLDKIEQQYDLVLDSACFTEYPTINKLSNYLLTKGSGVQKNKHHIKNMNAIPNTKHNLKDKIAIIGMAGRFPGSKNIEEYWNNLEKGNHLICEVPRERWSIAEYYSPDKLSPNKSYSKWGGFLDDIELFDAAYFKISEEDAIMLDPSQRLMLELINELIERSGYQKDELNGDKIGVFIGGGNSNYHNYFHRNVRSSWRKHLLINSIQNMQAGRISDFYNFTGPSYTIDSACSSSLVAIHQACESLLSGECDYAIAGGVELLIGPDIFINFSKAGVLSGSDKCHVFDELANGMVLGEGLGAVLLKNLQSAINDGDEIIGIIMGSSINNDGCTPGITVPNLLMQKKVIGDALSKSGISPNSITYYEAHGTGTLLGDPIEIKAMSEVYREFSSQQGYCAVGSAKSNIGHLLRAAGMAGFIKVLLAMKHEKIPPTIHCDTPHPRFNFKKSPFYPSSECIQWNGVGGVHRAAISSFGFGGTNCHMILEKYYGPKSERKLDSITIFNSRRYWLGDYEKSITPADSLLSNPKKIYSYNELYLKDHLVFNQQVLLGVTHCSLAVEAVKRYLSDNQIIVLRNVFFEEAIVLQENQKVEVNIIIEAKNQVHKFANHYRYLPENESKISCSGDISLENLESFGTIDLPFFQEKAIKILNEDDIYSLQKNIYQGPSLRIIKQAFIHKDSILSIFHFNDQSELSNAPYEISPVILNAALVTGSLTADLDKGEETYIPFAIKKIKIQMNNYPLLYCLARLETNNEEIFEFSVDICDEFGNICVRIYKVACKKLRRGTDKPANRISASENQRAHELEALIRDYLSAKLQPLIDSNIKLDLKRNFMDMGVDSMKLIELTKQIEQEYKIDLYPTLFFEYPNIFELSRYFSVQHTDIFSKSRNLTSSSNLEYSRRNIHKDLNLIKYEDDVRDDDIAVIGMSGIFAQSSNLDIFWENILKKTDLITEVPQDHWDYHPWFDSKVHAPDKLYCKWGSFISDVDKFDASFFNILAPEAEIMDPQLRLLLQVLYATAEDAGYAGRIANTNTGMYIGACFHDYQQEFNLKNKPVGPHDGTGNATSMLANRPSFFFNLRGPSLVVDTACSSSLVALHLACQSLRQNECEMAFVGGTNLLLSSWHYRYFCSIGALSRTGSCNTFDNSADGYVPGEGVCSVLLKPFKKAIIDGDQIHAVIKGSATNHGGYCPSITAPNLQQEAEVMLKAWEAAKIDPSTISYIEAHGTGTKLGDPIEVKAIQKAFSSCSSLENTCAIGSVKAHIGHTEGAAGISGLIKVILAMKNRKIPAMPNFRHLNSLIQLSDSPLYINDSIMEWETKDGHPRRAGINSFGFGGTYAHVIVEEAPDSIKKSPVTKPCFLITLSAKNKDILKQYILDLKIWLDRQNYSDSSLLEKISYSLNTGRQQFDYRYAIVISSLDELRSMLQQDISSELRMVNKVQKIKENSQFEKLMNELSQVGINSKEHYKNILLGLAKYYLDGFDLDWLIIHQGELNTRISLPTYPFAKERYWMSVKEIQTITKIKHDTKHSLLDDKILTSEGAIFTKEFSLDDIYISDHIINGIPILPGVIQLEMILAAGKNYRSEAVCTLSQVAWIKPIAIMYSKRCFVKLSLYPMQEGVRFEITTESKNVSNPVQESSFHLHTQGKIFYNPVTAPESLSIDLNHVQSHCIRKLSKEDIYSHFRQLGYFHGNSFQAIDTLWCNENEAVSKLGFPISKRLDVDSSNWVLNPFLLEGVLQTMIGLLNEQHELEDSLYFPFAFEEFKIFNLEPQGEVYSYITKLDNSEKSNEIKRFNIYLIDRSGFVLAVFKNFVAKLHSSKKISKSAYYYYPVWEIKDFHQEQNKILIKNPILFNTANDAELNNLFSILGKQTKTVINQAKISQYKTAEDYIQLFQSLAANNALPSHVIYWKSGSMTINDNLEISFSAIFLLVQALIKMKIGNGIHIVYIYENNSINTTSPFVEALCGLFKTISQEYPQIQGQILGIDSETAINNYKFSEILLKTLSENERHICYVANKRWIKRFYEINPTPNESLSFKENGVYLITGGNGTLGLKIAEHLVNKYQASLILTGRSELSSSQQAVIEGLIKLGSRVIYTRGNISDREEVKKIIKLAHDSFDHLDGILHIAGVKRDKLIINKSTQEIAEVLDPKIYGALHLDELTKELKLDFFVLFSSISSIFGNIGQSDYAYASNFLDGFAYEREFLRKKGKRSGLTLSINWPYWEEGGMQMDESALKWMRTNLGLESMSIGQGIMALEELMKSNNNQAIVLLGNKEIFTPYLNKTLYISTDRVKNQGALQKNNTVLLEKVSSQIQEILSNLLKIKTDAIDENANLSSYGLDSISIITVMNSINDYYKLSIAPTVLFEHSTLRDFISFLLENHKEHFERYYNLSFTQKIESLENTIVNDDVSKKSMQSSKLNDEPIAIIGIHGIFPGSSNLEHFWENLEHGKNVIQEIPSDRWDWKAYKTNESDNRLSTKWGGFIENIDKFDASFFNISGSEAELMDPQQRLFLQVVWSAIEDAGYNPLGLPDQNMGLFVGVSTSDYGDLLHEAKSKASPHAPTGVAHCILANRVSYFLNLSGPSEAIDTACSSSLVAIHNAIKAIRNNDCEWSIAGGVNLLLTPTLHQAFSQAGMLSEDGRCRAFDKLANGYVRGEGVGALLLKPLSKALRDNDKIYGLIRGSGVNHGGRVNSLTVPNPNAQAELIRKVYERAAIDINTVTYIETHGTGTPLGDPIEINGLKKAFLGLKNTESSDRSRISYCGLGSVKTNIGHLEAAAGIAGVIKVLLAMKNRNIPGNLNFETLNPHIEIENTPFYIVNKTQEWDQLKDIDNKVIPYRAGISSFGFGGMNAHIILEEGPSTNTSIVSSKPHYLITLSAKTQASLQTKVLDLIAWLEKNRNEFPIEDISYNLNHGRSHFQYRYGAVVNSFDDLYDTLQKIYRNKLAPHVFTNLDNNSRLPKQPIYKELCKMLIRDVTKLEEFSTAEYKDKLLALANLYVEGYEIDWQKIYQSENRRKISLPTYPFAKSRYWIKESSAHNFYYSPSWIDDSSNYFKHSLNVKVEKILFLQISNTTTDEIISILKNEKIEIITVNLNGYKRFEDYAKLIQTLINEDKLPPNVIYWNDSNSDIIDGLCRTFYAVYHFIKALINSKIKYPINFVYAYKICDESIDSVLSNALSSLWKTIAHESSLFQGRLLGLDSSLISNKEEFGKILLQSLTDNEREIYYSEEKRWVKRFEERKINLDSTPSFRKHGVYLITGGMGGLGLIIATHLATVYKARLVLIGRSELTVTLNDKLTYLNHCGAEVIYERVDISNKSDADNLIQMIYQRFKVLNGVIHLAGVIHDKFIIDKTPDDIERVLKPKIYGTLNLDDSTKNIQLDCFLLFSSITSLFGNMGQCDYAYANGFLDAFAKRREYLRNKKKRTGRTVSINWPLWKEGGMQVSEVIQVWMKNTLGMLPLSNEQGFFSLGQALQMDGPQLAVLAGDKNKIIDHLNRAMLIKPSANYHNTDHAADSVLIKKLSDHLQSIASDLLSIDSKDIDINLQLDQYGLDSIITMALVNTINHAYNLSITSLNTIKYKSIVGIATYLIENFQNEIQDCFYDNDFHNNYINDNSDLDKNISINKLAQEEIYKVQNYLKKIFNPSLSRRCIKSIMKVIMKLVFNTYFKLVVEGIENLPKDESFIICANHTSVLDAIILNFSTRRRIKNLIGLGAEDIWFKKDYRLRVNYIIPSFIGDVVPLSRDNSEASLEKNFKFIELCVNEKKVMVIFPEGTRSTNGELGDFKNGISLFASKLGLKLVPAYIDGAFKLMPKGKFFPKPGRLVIRFGQPINIDRKTSNISTIDYYRQITNQLKSAILTLEDLHS